MPASVGDIALHRNYRCYYCQYYSEVLITVHDNTSTHDTLKSEEEDEATYGQTDRHSDRQTDIPTDRHSDRQADGQTEGRIPPVRGMSVDEPPQNAASCKISCGLNRSSHRSMAELHGKGGCWTGTPP